jgi:hypothetical protein
MTTSRVSPSPYSTLYWSGTQLWAAPSSPTGTTVSRFAQDGSPIDSPTAYTAPRYFLQVGTEMWISCNTGSFTDSRIVVLDAVSGAQKTSINGLCQAGQMAYDGRYVWVSAGNARGVLRVDPTDYTTQLFPVGDPSSSYCISVVFVGGKTIIQWLDSGGAHLSALNQDGSITWDRTGTFLTPFAIGNRLFAREAPMVLHEVSPADGSDAGSGAAGDSVGATPGRKKRRPDGRLFSCSA